MLERTIIWRRIDMPGHDACALHALENGWRLAGTAIFSTEISPSGEEPCHLYYEVHCDISWHTRSATVKGWIGKTPVDITILAIPEGKWTLNGVDQKGVAGCIDVDLNFTPSTNLLSLRRLDLNIGERADVPVAWLRFPDLTLERLEQQYHHITQGRYDYRAPDTGYADMLDVTGSGFVKRYPGLWEMESLR